MSDLALFRPHDLDGPVRAVARRVKIGGRFGWWVGTLRREVSPLWTIWYCKHQHTTTAEARGCVVELIDALKGMSDPIRLRNESRPHE